MEYVALGDSGIEVSKLCVGCMRGHWMSRSEDSKWQ